MQILSKVRGNSFHRQAEPVRLESLPQFLFGAIRVAHGPSETSTVPRKYIF